MPRTFWLKYGVLVVLLSAALAAPVGAAPPDAWITAKTKLALLTTEGVRGTAVNVDTVLGKVTLHGKVRSAEEKANAESVAKKIEGVPLKIDKLKKYRDEYQGFMVDFAKAARAAAQMQSGDAPDVAKLQEAMNNLNTSVQKSSKLTTDINNYCQGKE